MKNEKFRVNNSAQIEYEGKFNDKINTFTSHSKYKWLRERADEALNLHTGFGLQCINAICFMDWVIAKPIEDIQKWLDDDEKAVMDSIKG